MPSNSRLPSRDAPPPARDPELAAALQRHRHKIALALLPSIADSPKYRDEILACGSDATEFLAREIYAFVDYLALWFRTGDSTYKHLYIGEKLKQLYEPGEDREARERRAARVLDDDRRALLGTLAGQLRDEPLAELQGVLHEIARVANSQSQLRARLLLIGDCLHMDVMSFLAAPCLEDQITLEPAFVTSKNPVEVRRQLRTLAGRPFDLIFYSPFSYEFSPAFASLMDWRRAWQGRDEIARLVDGEMRETERTIELLAGLFECPLVVHNSANVRRHDGSLRESLKNVLSRRVRRAAAHQVNRRLSDFLAERRRRGDNLVLLDEMPILNRHGERHLGQIFYRGGLQHPAVMGRHLAAEYRDLVVAQATLAGKKLLVCDLDNTIWHGVIGEGPVRHDQGRQQVLKRLRARGVLLAINSKNDPRNIHWQGALLNADDFVCAEINWEPKTRNMQRIQARLNLKSKDFVFLDDRQDERELVKLALPEILTLDATDQRAWRLLDAWSRLLREPDGVDRTLFYQQRDQRESYIERETAVDQASLFQRLDIRVTIRNARPADYKRVVELVNRTNQFNLCGSRLSLRELQARCDPGDFQVLLVDAADRFGSMGTVSALALQHGPPGCQIPIFVLSCRVFGYGIEDALLNRVKSLARPLSGDNAPRIVGHYRETPHNQPCRDVYPRNGFAWDGECWVYSRDEELADPVWLSVACDVDG